MFAHNNRQGRNKKKTHTNTKNQHKKSNKSNQQKERRWLGISQSHLPGDIGDNPLAGKLSPAGDLTGDTDAPVTAPPSPPGDGVTRTSIGAFDLTGGDLTGVPALRNEPSLSSSDAAGSSA
jgi:hypothetical protein